MRKIAVILYGPPGSGKGTQANLLADKFGLVHFDTGKFLEAIVHDPARQKEKAIRRERKLFDTGMLMTPSFVLGEVKREVKKIAGAGLGVVFSGSPRTMYEAEGLMPLLEKMYGKRRIFVFTLSLSPAESVRRNGNRMVCSVCKAPLLTAYYPSRNPRHCPICAGPFYKRTLDKPEVIRVRLAEYTKRTVPIFAYLRKRGYRLKRVNGAPAPYKVFQKIYGSVK
jgi:adenylate kinase